MHLVAKPTTPITEDAPALAPSLEILESPESPESRPENRSPSLGPSGGRTAPIESTAPTGSTKRPGAKGPKRLKRAAGKGGAAFDGSDSDEAIFE